MLPSTSESVRVPSNLRKLLGRADECAVLDRLIEDVRQGESRCLVLRGEAGIGKSALLEHLVESAADVTVARTVGVESEMEMPFASLHQLCAPMLDRLGELPAPQREALETVFGLAAGPAPDRFLVGLTMLSLLSRAAESGPLLCVIDDAQWLDQASAQTLAFVARRLLAEPVGVLFAAREPGEELRNLPELEVRGVGDSAARALLDAAVRFPLEERVRQRIVAETRGNPLALLELPRGLTAAQLGGGQGLVGGQGLSTRIEESYVRQLRSLPVDAQRLALLAAAEPLGDPLLLWRAGEKLGIPEAVVKDVEAQGLLKIAEQVTFRHPLARSAVYRSAPAEDRRAAHLALAGVTDREVDPDRCAWHLAAASPGPDEAVASELERSAQRAETRAGLAAAAGFLRRAVALTSDPLRRVERTLAAVEASVQAGAFDVARDLLDSAADGPLDKMQQARLQLQRGQLELLTNFGPEAPVLLLDAARRLESLDIDLARDTYLDAWGAALMVGRLHQGAGLLEVCRAAMAAPRSGGASRLGDLLLDSLATLVKDGRPAAQGLLEEAAATFADERVPVQETLRWGWLTVEPTYVLWDEDNTYAIIRRQMEAVRRAGWLGRLSLDVATLNLLSVRCGDFTTAEMTIAEGNALGDAIGAAYTYVSSMTLDAFRGREEDTRASIESSIAGAAALGMGTAVEQGMWLLAVLFNGLGRHQDVVDAAREESPDEPIIIAWLAPEQLEAAVRTGNRDLARTAFERVVDTTAYSSTEAAKGMQARCRALISEGAVAERLYEEAIERLGRTRLRPELARAHLLYGEWLRQEDRRVDARAQLRAALDQFTSIGMEAFAERTRRELEATGQRVRAPSVEARDDLTPQERQIARLAREGLSNAAIGAQLFLSPRTIEWHMHNVFIKLGIQSRRDLPAMESETVPA